MSKPKEKMVPYNGPMGLAIWEDRKSISRRPMKPKDPPVSFDGVEPVPGLLETGEWAWLINGCTYGIIGHSPFGRVGDINLIREPAKVVKFGKVSESVDCADYRMEALLEFHGGHRAWRTIPDHLKRLTVGHKVPNGCWKGSERSRRVVTEVRVERVQDITEAEAIAEGFPLLNARCPYIRKCNTSRCEVHNRRYAFAQTWNAIYPGSWERNDWVWVAVFAKEVQS